MNDTAYYPFECEVAKFYTAAHTWMTHNACTNEKHQCSTKQSLIAHEKNSLQQSSQSKELEQS